MPGKTRFRANDGDLLCVELGVLKALSKYIAAVGVNTTNTFRFIQLYFVADVATRGCSDDLAFIAYSSCKKTDVRRELIIETE